jgi:hypothetical protein
MLVSLDFHIHSPDHQIKKRVSEKYSTADEMCTPMIPMQQFMTQLMRTEKKVPHDDRLVDVM